MSNESLQFIDEEYIHRLLGDTRDIPGAAFGDILDKALKLKGLTHQETAALLSTGSQEQIQRIFEAAKQVREQVYGDRIVLFAPLYISDLCVNSCLYCSFRHGRGFSRKKLSQEQIRAEVRALEAMGHKRLALEAGEDPDACPIEYVVDALKTIYSEKHKSGDIRRVNVNIAATGTEDYRKLKEAGIGTYILFQETYHRRTYETVHPAGPKSDYLYHLTALDRAMEAGLDDVGAGVLFGLYDSRFEAIALILHNEHLEREYGVGFHTISLPRIRPAQGSVFAPQYMPSDQEFLRTAAVLRLAVPFTGIIISTRESPGMRKKLIDCGISQLSGGSRAGVGGYSGSGVAAQFDVDDERPVSEIIECLIRQGNIPSFCTACYRSGRTGEYFMDMAKSGNIKNLCLPNSLITLAEYAADYGSEEIIQKAGKLIADQLDGITDESMRERTREILRRIKNGERDLYV
ncbi:MAG: [FeFe] hydrogenase H-cluster radical SAM maturase HydG [Oscillospiraceae bacterium]|nr:[FeFe] hydrogenase H-cluster radical SAM maturase HydG [Oscillospiraceae bacterium]